MNDSVSQDSPSRQAQPQETRRSSEETSPSAPSGEGNRRPSGRRPRANDSAPRAPKSGARHGGIRAPAALATLPRDDARFSRKSPRNTQPPPKRPDGRVVRQPFNGQAHLYEVIQVRIARTRRLVEVNTAGFRLDANTPVLIRLHRNILLATTVGCRYRRVAEINVLPFVIRTANDEDLLIDAENAGIEKSAQELASDFAISQNLQMKVLSADLSHDHKNITINFASDVRIDFREMVAYLAGKLKMRVEMFQLGLRNGTGLICGIGSCGQLLCCGRFLGQFDPIAVRQLRAQGLATNPKRISGVCGRLYCCMSYEYCDYAKDNRTLPKKGKRVLTRWGIGRVTDIDMIREDIVVTYENGEVQRMTALDYVPVTDEILADVESGKLEFPIEPARFYLNADPAGAFEPAPAGAVKPRPQPKLSRPSAGPNGKPVCRKAIDKTSRSLPSRPKSESKSNNNKDNKDREARRESKNASKSSDKSRPHRRRAGEAKTPDVAMISPTPDPSHSKVLVPTPDASPAARNLARPSTGEVSHAPRPPRKVKARHITLEEDVRNEPGHTSRRRIPPQNSPDFTPR